MFTSIIQAAYKWFHLLQLSNNPKLNSPSQLSFSTVITSVPKLKRFFKSKRIVQKKATKVKGTTNSKGKKDLSKVTELRRNWTFKVSTT